MIQHIHSSWLNLPQCMSPPAPNQVVCFFPDAVYFLPSLPPTVPVNLSISSCHFHSLPHPSLLSTLISLPILLPLSPNLPLPLWHLLLSACLLFTVTPTMSTNNNLLLFPLHFFFLYIYTISPCTSFYFLLHTTYSFISNTTITNHLLPPSPPSRRCHIFRHEKTHFYKFVIIRYFFFLSQFSVAWYHLCSPCACPLNTFFLALYSFGSSPHPILHTFTLP